MPMPRTVSLMPCAGINNFCDERHPVYSPAADGSKRVAVRAATNFDLTNDGRLVVRSGQSERSALVAGEGGFEVDGRFLHQEDGTLYEGASALVAGLTRRASVFGHAGMIYVTDGVTHKEIDGSTVRNWGLPVPTLSLAAVAGDLPAGVYHVQASFSDARTNEGGACKLYAITLNGSQDIRVTVGNSNSDVAKVNLFAGIANQRQTSFVTQITLGQSPYTITNVVVSERDPPRTRKMSGPWSGIKGAFSWRAFVMAWRDNVVVRSEAQEPHLFHADSIYPFGADVTAGEGLISGFYVGTEQGLHWVSGDDPGKLIPEQKTFAPIFQGSMLTDAKYIPKLQSSGAVALFVSADGVLAGLAGGVVANLTSERYVFSSGSRASFTYAERRDALRQFFIAVT
jgi:hypothetical protein